MLFEEMATDPFGHFSTSVYETGRLVSLAPLLRGHQKRIEFLLGSQRVDGGWGGPDGYDIVPTLSATEALLETANASGGRLHRQAARAADRALYQLRKRLDVAPALPDTVAIELIVPALIGRIVERHGIPLRVSRTALNQVAELRSRAEHGHEVSAKLHHCLEIVGEAGRGATGVEPVRGAVGCSPAATAVWLGDPRSVPPGHPSIRYLDAVQSTEDGSVPVAAPLTVFERSWVLTTLADAGLVGVTPPALTKSIEEAFGEHGLSAGPGLPADSDDTAMALRALGLLGRGRTADSLWHYWTGDHFACFETERTPSVSANAHVLQVLGAAGNDRRPPALDRLTTWLVDNQEPDGRWWDKWHASPYYATNSCVLALSGCGGRIAAAAAAKAASWVLRTQHDNGSWGHWGGTAEETAYALRILTRATPSRESTMDAGKALDGGIGYLERRPPSERHPPLWHDKDLYTPYRIVRAEIQAALKLARDYRRSP